MTQRPNRFCTGLFETKGEYEWVHPEWLQAFSRYVDTRRAEEKKQAAAKALLNYSQFVMSCIGEDARPGQLRLHLMKEVSGMPTSLIPGKGANADKGQTSSQPLEIKDIP